ASAMAETKSGPAAVAGGTALICTHIAAKFGGFHWKLQAGRRFPAALTAMRGKMAITALLSAFGRRRTAPPCRTGNDPYLACHDTLDPVHRIRRGRHGRTSLPRAGAGCAGFHRRNRRRRAGEPMGHGL